MLDKARHGDSSSLLLVLGKEMVLLRVTLSHPLRRECAVLLGMKALDMANCLLSSSQHLLEMVPQDTAWRDYILWHFPSWELSALSFCSWLWVREGIIKKNCRQEFPHVCHVLFSNWWVFHLPFCLEHWMVLQHNHCSCPWEKAEKGLQCSPDIPHPYFPVFIWGGVWSGWVRGGRLGLRLTGG